MTKSLADGAARELRAAVDEVIGRAPGLSENAVSAFERVVDVIAAGGDAAVFDARELITTGQAAALLGVSRMTVVRLIERGELEAGVSGSHRRIAVSELARYQTDSGRRRREALAELASDINDTAPADEVIMTR